MSRVGYKQVQRMQGALTANAWWLAGGIDPGDCVAAFSPKGAVSYAASKIRLGGSLNTIEVGSGAAWDTVAGWSMAGETSGLYIAYQGDADTSYIADVSGGVYLNCFFGANNPGGYGITAYAGYFFRHGRDSNGIIVPLSGIIAATFDTCYSAGTPVGSFSGVRDYQSFVGFGVFGQMQNTNMYSGLGSVARIAVYSRKLSDTEVAAVSAAMAAL